MIILEKLKGAEGESKKSKDTTAPLKLRAPQCGRAQHGLWEMEARDSQDRPPIKRTPATSDQLTVTLALKITSRRNRKQGNPFQSLDSMKAVLGPTTSTGHCSSSLTLFPQPIRSRPSPSPLSGYPGLCLSLTATSSQSACPIQRAPCLIPSTCPLTQEHLSKLLSVFVPLS